MKTKDGTHFFREWFKVSNTRYINTALPTHQLHTKIHLKHIIYLISQILNFFVWVMLAMAPYIKNHHPSSVTWNSLTHNYRFYQITTLANNYSWPVTNLQTQWHDPAALWTLLMPPFKFKSFKHFCQVFMTWTADNLLVLLSPSCHRHLISYPTFMYLWAFLLHAISIFLILGRAVLHMQLYCRCQIMK
jgi:hypothetical protein